MNKFSRAQERGHFRKLLIALSLFSCFYCSQLIASSDINNRLGIGFSRQLLNNIPAISVKIQKSEQIAIGALFGLRKSDTGTGEGYGAAVKIYRNLFVEPQLRFYSSVLLGLVGRKESNLSQNGIQIDGTMGSEFHFTGIESLGFSIEFGASLNKIGGSFNIETVGHHMLLAGVHFYL